MYLSSEDTFLLRSNIQIGKNIITHGNTIAHVQYL